jgi:hypothetical protein
MGSKGVRGNKIGAGGRVGGDLARMRFDIHGRE